MGNLKDVDDEAEFSNGIADLHIDGSRGHTEAEAGDDDEEAENLLVGLGFVQPVEDSEKWKVERQHFPSKVGGCPAWLDPINIPTGEQSTCGICDSPLEFLLQVYAPIDDIDDAFHRSLFVFVCPNASCLEQDRHHQSKKPEENPRRCVKVFRSQLLRKNSYYSYTPPSGEDDLPISEGAALCTWCGIWKGHKACAACKQTKYCSRSHQVEHWRGSHAVYCRQVQAARKEGKMDVNIPVCSPGPVSDKLWPEMELVVDEEDNYEVDELSDPNANVPASDKTKSKAQLLLEDYERRREAGEEFTAADLEDVHEASQDMQLWAAFLAKIGKAPDQVLRYCRSPAAKPLWLSLNGQPENSGIPSCSHCGSRRIFEFQVLPQLLNFLDFKDEANSLDWGTIAVYTCERSCGEGVGKGYAEEFAWVQPPPE
ncbi:uncharacterized protein [Physcomitrium patens]|nr:programmed cell death protein 2-like [Physcomitrium patens]PNR27262.1 hypothetical protein PHYPA_029414 [Physcomitrium patens]|eukprot:XP_024365835.1 programmed cell death protein 2-like [Physcomitrella patens]